MNRQEELELRSDLEINWDVHQLRLLLDGESKPRDYCNSPNDVMPIALGNDIQYWRRSNTESKFVIYEAQDGGGRKSYSSRNKNPYRAICIVYILMSEYNEIP